MSRKSIDSAPRSLRSEALGLYFLRIYAQRIDQNGLHLFIDFVMCHSIPWD